MKVSKLLKVINGKGATFCAVRGYTSEKTGEVANYLIQSGYSYENANAHDLAILKAANPATVAAAIGESVSMVSDAIAALIQSIEAPNKRMSQAQKDTYTHLGAGIKEYNGSEADKQGNIYVTGLVIRKQTIVKGVHKEVKSKPETIVKSKVSKHLQLRKENIRQYILKNGEFKLRGVTLTG